MIPRYEAVGAILNSWYQARVHYLPWPDESMKPVADANRQNHVIDGTDAEWEKDWIDIGGEG